ncbi:uncharacterized protein METZ01_LOCUS254833, partial [marine metagenome]
MSEDGKNGVLLYGLSHLHDLFNVEYKHLCPTHRYSNGFFEGIGLYAGAGLNDAHWLFTGLAMGSYDLDRSFHIRFDQSNKQGDVALTKKPSGAADFREPKPGVHERIAQTPDIAFVNDYDKQFHIYPPYGSRFASNPFARPDQESVQLPFPTRPACCNGIRRTFVILSLSIFSSYSISPSSLLVHFPDSVFVT